MAQLGLANGLWGEDPGDFPSVEGQGVGQRMEERRGGEERGPVSRCWIWREAAISLLHP